MSPSDRAALLKIALEMIERKSQWAGDEFEGTLTARRLVDGGYLIPATAYHHGSKARLFAGYLFTMKGNAAVGELARLIHKITGIGDS